MAHSNRDMPNLINFLRQDGYDLVSVSFNPRFGATTTAKFSKMTHIEELDGNDVNDATINITVDFDTRFDYRNAVEDEEEGLIYNDFTQARRQQFIDQLWNRTYDNPPPVVPVPQGAPSNGGKRKSKKSKRKTRKNKRR